MNASPSSFWQWVASQDSGDLVGLLLFCVAAVVLIVLIMAITFHYVHKNRLNYSLKRELLDRGMSADEIATIISAEPAKCGLGKTGHK